MSSNSDMESVSISDVEMEEDEQVAPVTTSQPAPQASVPIAGISLPQASSQPTPKRITMRERALAMREARLQKNKAKSAKKQSVDVAGKNPTQNGTNEIQGGRPENGAAVPVPRQKLTPRKSPRSTSKATPESTAELHGQESAANHQATDGRKPEAQGTAKGKKANARRDGVTKKNAKTNPPISKPAETLVDLGDTEQKNPQEPIPNGHSAPSKDDSQTSKASSGTRKHQRKRKSTADPAQGKQGKDDSGSESDVILLQSRVVSPASPRVRKKARIEDAKSAVSPKASSKSLKKKKETSMPPLTAATTIVAPVAIVPMDVQQNGNEAPSRKKKTTKKNTRANVGSEDDDEPIVVRYRKNKSGAENSSKLPSSLDAIEQTPKPVPPKRRPGRPRKYPKVDEPESQAPPTTTAEEEISSKAKQHQDESVPPKKTPRQAKPRARKARTVAPTESESAKKPNVENEGDLEVSKVKRAPRQPSRSASKRRSSKPAASEQPQEPNEDHETPELVSAKETELKPTEADGNEARVNEASANTVTQSTPRTRREPVDETALHSVKKSKGLPFALSSPPRRTSTMPVTDFKANASRRQSLTHEEGLSRLTSVVDQLQREGEAFLQTEHRICDQLVPFNSDTSAHPVSALPYENIGVPVSEVDRKVIADAALRDAVVHAKLEYQANHRAAISRLAENLVQAVKDWKNAKNAVLRDIIPEELRPKIEAPLQTSEYIGHNMEGVIKPPTAEGTTDFPGEPVHNENEEQIEGLNEMESPKAVSIRNGNTTRAREDALAGVRVLINADAVKKYVGFSYSDLGLSSYRVCAILKLCEFDSGLSIEELHDKTPFGKSMIRKNVAALVKSKHLMERTIEVSGQLVTVYRTAPNFHRIE